MFFDKFEDTIFLKESSNLQKQYEALLKLKEKYSNNNEINEELKKILRTKPTTIEELKNANILTPIKIKTHGNEIVEIIKNS